MEPYYTAAGLEGSMRRRRRRPPPGLIGSNPEPSEIRRHGLRSWTPGWERSWEAAIQTSQAAGAKLRERPGEPDCAYYVNFGLCRFGERCKLNHPRDRKSVLIGDLVVDGGGRASAWMGILGAAKLPERPLQPGQPDCPYYLKFGTCRFGEHCKFNHPLDRIYEEEPLLPPQHNAGSGSSSSPPESMVDVDPPSRLTVTAEEDPLLSMQHRADFGSNHSLPEVVLHVDSGRSPSRPTSDEEEPLLSLQHPAGSGSSSSPSESMTDVDPPSRLTAEEGPLLSLRYRADFGSSHSLPEAVLHVDAGRSPSRPTSDEDEAAEPLLLLEHPADSGSNDREQEDAVDVGADISLQPEPSLPLQHPADSGIINPELDVVIDVGADVSLQGHPFLPLQYPADRGRNNSLAVVVVDADAELSASMSTTQHVEDDVHGTPDDQIIKEQQDRCIKYSKKALEFAITTFIDYAVSVSSTRCTVLTKASMAAFFVAICFDLFSLMKKKRKWSCTLVYVSWFHLVLMTTLIFVSLNKDYVYAILIVPLMIGAALLQHKLWPQERRRSTGDDRAHQEQLKGIFNLTALIVNLGSLITAVFSIVRRIISGPGNYRTVHAAGFLLFFTVVVGLYLMMVTTVRHAALILHAKYLQNLFMGLVVGTIITILGPIWFH